MCTFALSNNCFDWDTKKFSRQIKTKKFCNMHKGKLDTYADRLTRNNYDVVQIVGGLLIAAYGVNIGKQVEALLKEGDYIKIRKNILEVVYNMKMK